ncbi:MAG: aminopeptidase [Candidatus Bathyarchaeia archaeon]
MPEYYEYELGKAAYKLVSEMLSLKPKETLVITADTESDTRVVEATAAAAFVIGSKPMVIWTASPLGVGKAADPMLPLEALTAALNNADAWVEFNNKWLLYSTLYERVMTENKKIRHMCLVGMNVDMMIRVIARVDLPTLGKYIERLTALTKEAKHVRMTTPTGTNVEFDNDPERPVTSDVGYADKPGSHFLGGQIGWAPIFDSINGTIVFDGSIVPPVGLVKKPVKLYIKEGTVIKIEGDEDARAFEAWLKSFNDPNMFQLAHVCYGCNPGAKLTGNIIEDERVWGCTEWGLGYVGADMLIGGKPIPAASHTDGICLNTSVWLDEEQIWNEGKMIHPELVELAKALGKI